MIFTRAVGKKKKAIALHCKQGYSNPFCPKQKVKRQLLIRLLPKGSA